MIPSTGKPTRIQPALKASRRATGLLFGIPLAMLLLVAGINFAVDPLHQFHRSWFGFDWDQYRYTLPGLARRADVPIVIMGASTSYYFSQEVNKIFGQEGLNLSVPGGTLKEQRLLLDLALSQKVPRQVLWGVEWFSAGFTPDAVRIGDFPYFLYEPLWRVASKYLMDVSMATLSLRILAMDTGQLQSSDLIDAQVIQDRWLGFKETGADKVRSAYVSSRNRAVESQMMNEDLPSSLELVKLNLERNLLGTIKNHPNIHFTLFLPPHSIAGQAYLRRFFPRLWDVLLLTRHALIDRAATFKNVVVFDFQIDSSMNSDFAAYADLRHFSKAIGEQMLTQMASGASRVRPGTATASQAELERQIEAFEKQCGFCRADGAQPLPVK